jgi:hypothetical protein
VSLVVGVAGFVVWHQRAGKLVPDISLNVDDYGWITG